MPRNKLFFSKEGHIMGVKRTAKRGYRNKTVRRSNKKARVAGMRSFNAVVPRYEKKFLDSPVYIVSATAGSIQADFNGLAQGSAAGQRVGNRVNLTNFNLHAECAAGTKIRNEASTHRIILFIDKQCNGAAPAVTDILQTASVYSFRNMYTLDRFVILKDKLFTLNANAPGSSATTLQLENSRVIKMSWKGNLPIFYSGIGSGVGNISSNNVGLLYICDTANQAGDAQGMVGTARVKYTDA